MKITARISAAMGQLKTSAAHTFGKAFGRTARVVENPTPNRLERLEVLPFPVIKTPKGDVNVIKNMHVNFERDDYEVIERGKIVRYLVNATHDDVTMTYSQPAETAQFCCRHMIVEELVRREAEKLNPTRHTKADRAKVFDVKHAPHLATQRHRLERRLHDLILYSDDIHFFKNAQMGMFLNAELKKLKVGEVKNFAFLAADHAMTLTLKHKNDGYSVSFWDPNHAAQHKKMKFKFPGQTTSISVETFMGPNNIAPYTRAGTGFKAFELPKGWAEDAPKYTPEVKAHFYELGTVAHEVKKRADYIKEFPGTNI